jgi:hypothetical protein
VTVRRKLIFAGVAALVVAVGGWLYLTRWTPEDAENAQHFQQALLEVRSAIVYANDRGGMLEPSDARFLIGSYERAAEHAAQVRADVLVKIHPDLEEIWTEAFLPSTNFFRRAMIDQDRDLARRAGLLQDDWVRWLQLNGHQLDVPDAP